MSFKIKNGDSIVTGDFSKLEKLVENLGKKYYVDIGIMGEKSKTEKGGLTTAGIGAVHEFGTDRAGRGNKTVIPQRSFIRMPLETGQDQIEKDVEPKLQKLLADGNIKGIFKLIGTEGEKRIQEAFETSGFGTWDPNAESTIRQKGSDMPLIDERDLSQGVSSRVGGD